jgi:DNA polymerase-3 subunit epsilon
LVALIESTWFPSLIAFGKFKGRNFREATADSELHGWLRWLTGSSNARSASMGQWYLAQLEAGAPQQATVGVAASDGAAASALQGGSAVVLYLSPQKAELQHLINAARDRLVGLEAEYTAQKHAVDVTLARLFQALHPHYQRRDQLQLNVEYRRKYLDALMQAGDEEAEEVAQAHAQARQQTNAEYEQAAAEAASKHALTAEQAQEMQGIWRKLVRIFHPDRCMDDPEKRKAHEWLTAEINQARDRGDIQRLREIAQNPDAFLLKQGMAPLSQDDSTDVLRLRTLLDSLQQRVLESLEALNDLRETSGYELQQRMQQDSEFFAATVAEHIQALEAEIAALETEAARLAEEIEGLTGVTQGSE